MKSFRELQETKGAPKGYHFTRDGKLKKGDAGADGPGGKKLRSDPLDKQRSKIPPLPEEIERRADAKVVKTHTPDGKVVFRKQKPEIKVEKMDHAAMARDALRKGDMKAYKRHQNSAQAAKKRLGEAAPKPLNRSDHTHTVHIDGEGKYRVKAKSMDHAKKVAFKQAGISKLHGHPTMEPKTRIYGEDVNERALTPGEKKKREEIAKAIERDHPSMPMDKKMAIATARAKTSAENYASDTTPKRVTSVDVDQAKRDLQHAKLVKKRQSVKTEATVDTADIAKKQMMSKSDKDKLVKIRQMLDKEKKNKPTSEATEKPPFSGPYTKAGSVRKDKFGNVIKNLPRHLARKAAQQAADQKKTASEAKLDELSPATMARYHSAADKSKARGWAKSDLGKSTPAAALKNQEKRTAGQKLARKKINQKAFRTSKTASEHAFAFGRQAFLEGRKPKDAQDEGPEHIMMQLRKSVNMRGQKDVTFKDGKSVKVNQQHAQRALDKYNRMKPLERLAFQKQIAKSHNHLQQAIK